MTPRPGRRPPAALLAMALSTITAAGLLMPAATLAAAPGRLAAAPGRLSAAPGRLSAAPGPDPELDAIRARLARANEQTARVLGELKSLDARIFRAGKDITGGEREVAGLQSEIRSAEAQTAELEEKIRQTKKTLNARAASIYKYGPSSILAPLFTARSWSELMRQPVVWRNLAMMDGKIVLESTRLKEELAARRADLARSSERIRVRNAELDASRDRLAATRRERQGSLGKLRTAIQEAMAAEKAVMAARAAAVKKAPSVCVPGSPDRDRKLQALLEWYAPATGPAGFLPPKLSATGVVTNGSASWYGPGFDGCRSSSGATFRASQMTAASLSLPLGTLLRATSGGKSAVVVITDRGPYVAGRDLDLSKAAAQAIGISGVGPVSMEILLPAEPAPAFP